MGRAPVVAGLVWLAGTAAATAVSLSAVRIVGEQIGGSPAAPLSGLAVRRALADLPATTPRVGTSPSEGPARVPTSPGRTGPPPAPSTAGPGRGTAAPGSSPSPPAVTPSTPAYAAGRADLVSRSYVLPAGTATVGCAGDVVSLSFASPAAGYDQKVDSAGPAEVNLSWESRSAESRLRVTCTGGVPHARVEEHGAGHGRGPD